MRKDTVIMVVLVAGVAAGVYQGLQFVAPNHKEEAHVNAMGGEANVEVATTSDAGLAEAGMETGESEAAESESSGESLSVVTDDQSTAIPSTGSGEAEPTMDAGSGDDTSTESMSSGQPDEMEEAAVRAAVAEAQRTAAEAAEKAVREAYRARKAANQ